MTKDRIHWHLYLSQNFLVKDDEGNSYTNTSGLWAMFAYVTITRDVRERLDRSTGLAHFIGHLSVRSKPFLLSNGYRCPDLNKIHNELVEFVDKLVDDNKYSDITQACKTYEL